MTEQPKKNYVGNAKAITGKYGTFYNISLNVNKLKEICDEKGYARVTMNENREPDKYGNSHSLTENTWRATPQDEAPVKKDLEAGRPTLADVPF